MTTDAPIACSLEAGELKQRLAAIADIGANSLVSRDIEGAPRHLLHFRADPTTRRRLEDIIAAEARCCSFLDLSLSEEQGELILSICAPEDAQALADGLAGAFGPAEKVNGNKRISQRGGMLIGAGGLALAVCCIALPVIFGVAIGATLGGVLDIGAAVLVAVGIAIVLHRRRSSRCC